jgi:hypothetical protein
VVVDQQMGRSMISGDQEHHSVSEQATFQEEEIRILVEQELSHQKDHCRAPEELNNGTTSGQPIIQSIGDKASASPPSDLQASVIQASPTTIDEPIQQQGHELHEMLWLFKQMISSPLSGFVLRTAQHKSPLPMSETDDPSDHAQQSLENKDAGAVRAPR